MSNLDESADAQPQNSFATIPDVPIQPDSQRVAPQDIASGVSRGTQKVINADGSYMTIGLIPDNTNTLGIAFFDRTGTLISKVTGATHYVYDKTTGKNIMQIGLLPDSTYGWAVARSGYNVSEGITGVS